MKPVAVKICGITSLEDGLAALHAGASLLGFNFYPPSPRYLLPADCARIVAGLRASGLPFQAVGVFVNQGFEEIENLLELCGLDLAQLSGDEPSQTLSALGLRAFKAMRPANMATLRQAIESYPARMAAPACLVDASRPGHYGGTGHLADWDLASELARRQPILLAGGLNPENVPAAIRRVQPWGVDVASGVEASPGRKDSTKLTAFMQAVNSTYKEPSHAEHPLE